MISNVHTFVFVARHEIDLTTEKEAVELKSVEKNEGQKNGERTRGRGASGGLRTVETREKNFR